ncbi:XAC0095 family protein [Luteimonas salinilitoris]|uniref:XAC0095 family protein n=1 Tax=Luteimonas salinilitoris TaxID=3237697 RepID=A0ABV4HXD5_9GAMM
MRKHTGSEPSRPTSIGYLLPEDAHLALTQTRDQLRLLALLADPRGSDEPDLMLRPGALAECFWRLAGDLDEVAEAAAWTGKGGGGN